MKGKHIGRASAEPRTDWRRLRAKTDEEVRAGLARDCNAQPTDSAFWRRARVVMPERKRAITIRLDADVLRWLRRGSGYQTRINAILRAYMEASR